MMALKTLAFFYQRYRHKSTPVLFYARVFSSVVNNIQSEAYHLSFLLFCIVVALQTHYPIIMSEAQNNEGGNEGSRGAPRRPRGDKTCYNCGQDGHIARNCENERLEGEAREKITNARAAYRRCFNCGKFGHISADCTKPAGNKSCYNCGKEGHIAKDCAEARAE